MEKLSHHSVRRIIKEAIGNTQVSNRFIESVKERGESLLREIALESIRQMKSENELRKLHNLRPIKRLTRIHTESVLSRDVYKGLGRSARHSRDTDPSVGRSYT